MAKKKKEIKYVPLYVLVVKELEEFQKHLDDPKKVMLKADLRAWAGHANYIITQLVKDIAFIGNQGSDKIEAFMKKMEELNTVKEIDSDYFS